MAPDIHTGYIADIAVRVFKPEILVFSLDMGGSNRYSIEFLFCETVRKRIFSKFGKVNNGT